MKRLLPLFFIAVLAAAGRAEITIFEFDSQKQNPSAGGAPNTGSGRPEIKENHYYWEGVELYTLGRYTESFEAFQKAIENRQNVKESEAYLLQIRKDIMEKAKLSMARRKTAAKDQLSQFLSGEGDLIQIRRLSEGLTQIRLSGNSIFEQNSAFLRRGGLEVLDRVAALMRANTGQRLEVVLEENSKEENASTTMKELFARRSLVVFGYLPFRILQNKDDLPAVP